MSIMGDFNIPPRSARIRHRAPPMPANECVALARNPERFWEFLAALTPEQFEAQVQEVVKWKRKQEQLGSNPYHEVVVRENWLAGLAKWRERDELKPCPFCGGLPEVTGSDLWQVECQACYVAFRGFYTREDAVEAWNARINEDHHV